MSIVGQPMIDFEGGYAELQMTALSGRRYRVTITSDAARAESWVRETVDYFQTLRNLNLVRPRPKMPVGLAIQWDNHIFASTLQLCVANRVLMVQLSQVPQVPSGLSMVRLRSLLVDPSVEFGSFLNAEQVRRMLFYSPHSLVLSSTLHDLREVVPRHLRRAGLAQLIYSEQAIGGFNLGHPQGPPWHFLAFTRTQLVLTANQLTVATLLPFAAFHIADERLEVCNLSSYFYNIIFNCLKFILYASIHV